MELFLFPSDRSVPTHGDAMVSSVCGYYIAFGSPEKFGEC